MPRTARKKSESGIYHVIIRGINRQNIFADDEDRIRFLETLDRYREETGCELYAYCLMSNHVHLLVKENDERLSNFMKRVNGSYAYWYNWKYDHVGHLFQDRFRSEPVDDDAYFLTVVRYIHRNPLMAGVTTGLEYAWSSYTAYLTEHGIINTQLLLGMMNTDQYIAWHQEETKADECLDVVDIKRIDDETALDMLKRIAKVKTATNIQQMEKAKRDAAVRAAKEQGLSVRQIARLTGLNRGTVLKA